MVLNAGDGPMADGVADELAKLAALRDSGNISAAEYEAQKQRLLAPAAPRVSDGTVAAPKKASTRAGCLTLLVVVAVAAIVGVIIAATTGGGPSAKYKATIVSITPINTAEAQVDFNVTNTGTASGTPSCTLNISSAGGAYTGFDVVSPKTPLAKGATGRYQDTLTVTNNGAANATVGASSVSC